MATAENPAGRGRRWAAFLSILSLLAGGAGSYGAVTSGLVDPARLGLTAGSGAPESSDWTAPSYIALDPMVISLDPDAGTRHLRLALHLEIAPGAERAVEASVPRILDVLNIYLRAVDGQEIETPGAMLRLRSQMLRRVQLVSPPETIRDLLVQEFIIN